MNRKREKVAEAEAVGAQRSDATHSEQLEADGARGLDHCRQLVAVFDVAKLYAPVLQPAHDTHKYYLLCSTAARCHLSSPIYSVLCSALTTLDRREEECNYRREESSNRVDAKEAYPRAAHDVLLVASEAHIFYPTGVRLHDIYPVYVKSIRIYSGISESNRTDSTSRNRTNIHQSNF